VVVLILFAPRCTAVDQCMMPVSVPEYLMLAGLILFDYYTHKSRSVGRFGGFLHVFLFLTFLFVVFVDDNLICGSA
jgi:hypothetical protein